MLVLVNGEYVVIERIEHEILENPVTVYNFQVADFHTYHVGEQSVLVHNANYAKGHMALWEHKNSNGEILAFGEMFSGGTHPGRRLNWTEQLQTHTEVKILNQLDGKTSPGDIITILGTKNPCNPGGRGCRNFMELFSKKNGVNIEYYNVTNGGSWFF